VSFEFEHRIGTWECARPPAWNTAREGDTKLKCDAGDELNRMDRMMQDEQDETMRFIAHRGGCKVERGK